MLGEVPSGKCGGGEKERPHGGGNGKREGRVESVRSSAFVRGLFLGPLLVDLTPACSKFSEWEDRLQVFSCS